MLKKLPLNTNGRDFVVGDVHGCFDMLERLMKNVGFDPEVDRMLSVGDLVDRGPKSRDVLLWLSKPWFHSVSGNHEDLAVRMGRGTADAANYILNGGTWFFLEDRDSQDFIAKKLAQLPYMIEVETDKGKVGIVHADIGGDNWDAYALALHNADSNGKRRALLEHAMWSRDRIRNKRVQPVEGVVDMYVGHTPVDGVFSLANVHYIDTAAVFGDYLTMVCIQGPFAGRSYSVKNTDVKN